MMYRDNRLNHIHEGTRGIQGLDLLGRKVPMQNGAPLNALIAEIRKTVATAADNPDLSGYANDLGNAVDKAVSTTMTMGGMAGQLGQETYLANATVYLDMLGHVVVAWLWLRQAMVALEASAGEGAPSAAGKLAACQYFFRYELPVIDSQCALLSRMDTTCLEAPAEAF